jgi:hypothetical protein
MKKAVAWAGMFVLVFSVSGCGSDADSLMKQQIQLMNDMADAIEKGDESKAKELESKAKELEEKMKALNLSDEDKKKLAEKYKADLEKAMGRLMGAALKKGFEGKGFPGE